MGETLDDVIAARAALPASDVLELGRQIASALAAVHATGLIHGDVKGANVMIEPERGAVLMDFGASQEAGSGSSPRFGTPAIMARNCLLARQRCRRATATPLASCSIGCLTGHYPVDAGGPVEELIEGVASLATIHNDAVALDFQGRPAEAEAYFRQRIEILDDWRFDPGERREQLASSASARSEGPLRRLTIRPASVRGPGTVRPQLRTSGSFPARSSPAPRGTSRRCGGAVPRSCRPDRRRTPARPACSCACR